MKNLLKPSRLALAVAAIALPLTATANQSLNAAGYASTIGGVINEGSVHSSSFNPAGNNLLLPQGDKFRFGYLSNLGGYVEIGESDDLDKTVDNLVDDLDYANILGDSSPGNQDYNNAISKLKERYGTNLNTEAEFYEAIAKRANTEIIADLEKGGQFRAGGQLQVPLTPFLIRSNSARGTFSINAAASMQMKGAFLGSDFGVRTSFVDSSNKNIGSLDINIADAVSAFDKIKQETDNWSGTITQSDILRIENILKGNNADGTEDLNGKDILSGNEAILEKLKEEVDAGGAGVNSSVETTFTTDSGLDVKAAVVKHIALGYGTNLTNWFELSDKHGQLEAGARLNVYSVETGRKFISLQAEANDNSGNSTSDNLTEDFLDNTATTTDIGLDIGFLWHAQNYQAGITFYNLNEPSFDYPDMGKVLTDDHITLDALLGLQGAGKTQVIESVKLTRHAVIEGAYYTDNRNWMIQGAYTLGTATNFVGDEFQNLHLSAGYYPKSAWLPGLRAGYSQNMKGAELSKIHAGATLFGIMHLDVAVSPDTSSFDGSDYPRYVAFSLGFEEKF